MSVALGLLYRHHMDLPEEIDTENSGQIPSSLIGYISGRNNPEPGYVGNWLPKLRMPYRQLYIPMFVYVGTRPASLGDEKTGAFGREFDIDPESVLPNLEIVCREDIQNAAGNKKPREWFADLRKLSPPEKIAALVEASRKSPSYAETRMHRPFRREDFLIPPPKDPKE